MHICITTFYIRIELQNLNRSREKVLNVGLKPTTAAVSSPDQLPSRFDLRSIHIKIVPIVEIPLVNDFK